MTMDGKLLARARERLAARREANAAERDRREAEAYAKAPELRHIDADLRSLVGKVIGLTGRGGDIAAELDVDPRTARRWHDEGLKHAQISEDALKCPAMSLGVDPYIF